MLSVEELMLLNCGVGEDLRVFVNASQKVSGASYFDCITLALYHNLAASK